MAKAPINQEVYSVDVSEYFQTEKTYENREEMIEWARSQALKAGFMLVIDTSYSGSERSKPKLVLGCERGGVYKGRKNIKREDTGSRKCGCPFRVRGYFSAKKEWYLNVNSGLHNHKMVPDLEGHMLVGRLTAEETKIVGNMTRNLIKSKHILLDLENRRKDNITNVKQMYNARHRFRRSIRGTRTKIQNLFKKLEDNKYVFNYRTVSASNTIQDIFFAHPKSVKLFNTFPTVLLMDSTYKTNEYKMPLLEIVGVTSTEMIYSVGFAFLNKEKEDNFTWALQECVKLLKCEKNMPKVIVTDRDTALMKAVDKIFPTSTALVCEYHISKNVRARCKLDCKPHNPNVKHLDLVNNIMDAWQVVVNSTSEELYVDAVLQFRKVCEQFPKFLSYVESTILNPLNKKLVKAWTDRVMHLGNTTTNRVESAHGRLKQYLQDSKGDLVKGWEAIHAMLTNQFTEIQATFGRNITVLEHKFKGNLMYKSLEYKISKPGLNYIFQEASRSKECGLDSKRCGCVIRFTHGLPCACKISKTLKEGTTIRLDEIDTHWKRLSFEDDVVVENGEPDLSIVSELKALQERFDKADYNMKLKIKEQVREIAFPETTSVTPPVQVVKTKGAQRVGQKRRKSTFDDSSTTREPSFWEHVDVQFPDSQASQTKPPIPQKKSKREGNSSWVLNVEGNQNVPYPTIMEPYIDKILNVVGDGYCGYRVVAEYLGIGSDSYGLVRLALIKELTERRDDYLEIFGENPLKVLIDSLYPPKEKTSIAPKEKWLTVPDMAQVIATKYRTVVVVLKYGNNFSETCFPLHGNPPPNPSSKIMCLGLLPNHFVHVFLKPGSPIPPTTPQWKRYRRPESQGWEDHFVARQCLYNELQNAEKSGQPPKETIRLIID